MARLLIVALLTVCLSVSAAPRKPADPDYQKKADAVHWPGDVDQAILFGTETDGYKVELLPSSDGWATNVIKGGKTVYTWTDDHPTGIISRDVLYRAVYSFGSNGCMVVAHDLKTGKQLWRSRLKGVGWGRPHSIYSNFVRVEKFDDGTLIVYGDETYGQYVEIVDLKTGKTVGHKRVARPAKAGAPGGVYRP